MEEELAEIAEIAAEPAVHLTALFFGAFVFEQASLVTGGALAAGGKAVGHVAFTVIYCGMVMSDWLAYAIGRLGVAWPMLRRRIGEQRIEKGRSFLARNQLTAALMARLVPGTLTPTFIAAGIFRVPFRRFAAINATVALVYAAVVFWGFFGLGSLLSDHAPGAIWIAAAAFVVLAFVIGRLATRRIRARR